MFDGLDTIVEVFFNGKSVLEGRNMHIGYRVDVTKLLKEGDENELELRFKNAPEFAKKEMKRIGYKGNGTDVHFGGPERLFVRKAQYHWGWDVSTFSRSFISPFQVFYCIYCWAVPRLDFSVLKLMLPTVRPTPRIGYANP